MKEINQFLKRTLAYFFQGLIFLIPITIVVGVFYYLWEKLSQLNFTPSPILTLLIILVGIVIFGFLTSWVLAGPVFRLLESALTKTPFVKLIYTSIKDLIEAFVGEKKRFNKPVLVTLNKEEQLQRLGFITATDLSDLKLKGKVAVYIPMSYSFSGNLYIVPSEAVEPLVDVEAGEVMKFIIAGGVTDIKPDEEEELSKSKSATPEKKEVEEISRKD